MRTPAPTPLGRWLLRLRAGAARRAEVEDDLVELFHLRVEKRGVRYAQWRWLLDAMSVKQQPWPRPPRTSSTNLMNLLWIDVRVGTRALLAQPRFTAIAMLLIALGIGVTTAVFSVVNAVLLRPLPYADPDWLVAVTGLFKSPARQTTTSAIALSEMAKWRPLAQSFESMGAFAYTQLPIRVGDRAFSPVTALMDSEFVQTLGVPLARGSFFPPGNVPGSERTVIISHRLWMDALAGDPAAVGRTVSVDGEPFEIRGVLAADFQFPRSDASYFAEPVDLLMLSPAMLGFPPSAMQWFGIARLKHGVPMAQAEAELQAIAEGFTRQPETGEAWSVQLAPLAEETTRRARTPLMIILGISAVLLLIASTNLMNLFFARGVGRLREMSIRRAIGSTTWQLLRLLLVESLVLALAGGLLGVWLASIAIKGIAGMSPVHLPVTSAIDIDGTVLAFTMLLCAGTAIVAGFFPALHVSVKTGQAVRTPGMRATASRAIGRVQQALCVAQIALGMALLACAGLLAHSLWRLNAIDPGFDTHRVLGFNLSVPSDVTREQRVGFYSSVLDEIRSIPGVERAALISFLPPETRAGVFMGVGLEGPPPTPGEKPRQANTLISSVDYFETMRMPLVTGRDFTSTDVAGQPLVVVVNEAFVRRYFADRNPIGRKIGTGFDRLKPVREIVGVVRDAHDRGVVLAPYPTIYVPFTQYNLGYGAIAVRTSLPLESIVPAIRERVRKLNPAVPLTDFQSLDDRVYEALREPRFYTVMAGVCAAMAVLFVTFGLYGLVSYSVSRRAMELGIRMAIGATRARIIAMVLAQGFRMALTGVALGLGLTFLTSRGLESLLIGIEPIDLPTFAAAAMVVMLVTMAASYAPARRASRVNPISVLRLD